VTASPLDTGDDHEIFTPPVEESIDVITTFIYAGAEEAMIVVIVEY
jgi:hypothetical protein